MSTNKIIQALGSAAGAAGGAALNVEDVFSTYLYDGTGTTNTINNGIDVSGEGGLVWIKNRPIGGSNLIFDTERGVNNVLETNANFQQYTYSNTLTSFNSNGFTVGSGSTGNLNRSGDSIASWTFRKAPKFFDVVTYTGDGVGGREIAHNLGATVGAIIIKRTDTTSDWAVFHRAAGENLYYKLNTADGYQVSGTIWDATLPTSTVFTVGSDAIVNASGGTYVAYLFAHNNGDGDFGDGTQDIIKCGSYGGNSSTTGPVINLGFEPQWLLVRRASVTGEYWQIVDNMRGVTTGGNDSILYPNATNAEVSTDVVEFNATGFQPKTTSASWNASGNTYIYIAIRRGPMAVPESATDVFDISHATDANDASFPVDFMLTKIMAGGNGYARDRLRGGTKYLLTDGTFADISGTDIEFDDMTGTGLAGWGTGYIHYNWRRAPNFFDVVAYTGNGTAGRTVSHNLGVAPEMMWIKNRGTSATSWYIYHKDIGNTNFLEFDSGASAVNSGAWNNTTPTDSVFTLGTQYQVNGNGQSLIAYLFATLAGVSKVGSFTHTSGSATNVDCGFSSGARFVIYKKSSATGSWYVFDTERGIVSGNDPFLFLDTTDAEYTIYDVIDPLSSGFTAAPGLSSGSYIFYAIA